MRFIGITGGIGSGKTEILSYIEKHYNCRIYLADQVAHEVKEKGQVCYNKLVTLLGNEILDDDGNIDKEAMARRIFSDNDLLEQVNAIIHPEVKRYILNKYEEAKADGQIQLMFVEAALLIEAGYKNLVDEMWYIYTDEKIRIERLQKSRGYSIEKIRQIMGNQLSEEEFRSTCDFVIDNSKSLEDSYLQIRKRLEEFTWRQ